MTTASNDLTEADLDHLHEASVVCPLPGPLVGAGVGVVTLLLLTTLFGRRKEMTVIHRMCSTGRCTNMVQSQTTTAQGPAFCSDKCKAKWYEDHPYHVPTLSGAEVTEKLREKL